ncbi:hypothetical protein [Aureivirga sp. CE67]|uniref:hypothetical protein n=1 Tax=Aureivirga sp. CE67 TaxID=1788983 RepID=UPI0018CB80B4|nr:hypothetical protein [Aureivirga sp. CE67]
MRKIIFIFSLFLIFSCKDDDDNVVVPEKIITGYMYTSTNANGQNAVLGFAQYQDGSLAELDNSPFFTKDLGASEQGDFDAQYSIRIIDDLLLVVNAGRNPSNGTISVFRIDKPSGNLTLIDQTPNELASYNINSRGIRPVTLDVKTINGKTWVIVGNQHSQVGYIGEDEELSGPIIDSNERNITLFSLELETGMLTFETVLDTYFDGNLGGVSSVNFNQNGDKFTVTTMGIYHALINYPNPSLIKPAQTYFYNFNNGSATENGVFMEEGVAGTVAAIWSPSESKVYTVSFNVIEDKIDYDVVSINTSDYSLSQHFRSGLELDNSSCWLAFSEDKRDLFAVNLGENTIASYRVGANDNLEIIANPYITRTTGLEGRELKDIISQNGFVYAVSAVNSHKISIFQLNGDGSLTELSYSPFPIPSARNFTEEDAIFLGLVGYTLID